MASTSAEIVKCYVDAVEMSQQMLDAARNGNWDVLITREDDRVAILDELKAAGDVTWSAEQLATVEKCIQQILDVDKKTVALVQQYQTALQKELGNINNGKKLRGTYLSP
jgi:ABC-type molybdate transport system substrate-binding protein